MLEFDDIQHFLIARPPALAARYEFLTFRHAAGGTRMVERCSRQSGHGKRGRARAPWTPDG